MPALPLNIAKRLLTELFLQNLLKDILFICCVWGLNKGILFFGSCSCKWFKKYHFVFIFQLQENQDEIENMMNAIFKGVFVHRYRYVNPWLTYTLYLAYLCWLWDFTASNHTWLLSQQTMSIYGFLAPSSVKLMSTQPNSSEQLCLRKGML